MFRSIARFLDLCVSRFILGLLDFSVSMAQWDNARHADRRNPIRVVERFHVRTPSSRVAIFYRREF